MPVGARDLTVLGEFKPFGLVAEALDGKPCDGVPSSYEYFLFNRQITRERDHALDEEESSTSASLDGSDHELFIRGNRIIWSGGARVLKRYSIPSPVIQVCWCRLGAAAGPFLCVLQVDTLAMYSPAGEEICIPLHHPIASIWPIPSGLLLQKAALGSYPARAPSLTSNLLLNERDLFRSKRELGYSSPHGLIAYGPQHIANLFTSSHHSVKGDGAMLSSHLILKDPLEEPQATFVEERGQLCTMKDFDERTIWTSDSVPLMASYNEGKMQHSLWLIENANSNSEVANGSPLEVLPAGILSKQFSFRRIWQGKVAQSAARKVFLATDDDGVLILCFLLQETKGLLSVRLQTIEINNETLCDVKPDVSWSIPAIAAAPVMVTHPSVSVFPSVKLQSGKQCLCQYRLQSTLARVPASFGTTSNSAIVNNLRITGIADAVDARINVIVNTGQMFRCALRRNPCSSLTNDCITALFEGLDSTFYNHFLGLYWGENDCLYLNSANSSVDLEWEGFSDIIMRLCGKSAVLVRSAVDLTPSSSWEFLINSEFHRTYCKKNTFARGTTFTTSLAMGDLDLSKTKKDDVQMPCKSFYVQLLIEVLDLLHALYENLKLDNLRKHDLELLAVLLCNIAKSLGEESFVDYYIRDFPYLALKIGTCQASFSSRTPPSLFRWLENCLHYGISSTFKSDLPALLCKDGTSALSWARKIVSFYSLLFGAQRQDRMLSSGVYCKVATGSSCTYEEVVVLAMVAEGFGLQHLDLLPAGVSLPLRHALDKCRESPPNDWPPAAYVLIGREDLASSRSEHTCKSGDLESSGFANLISVSAPYMLHLRLVSIPSTIFDTMGLDNNKVEETDSFEGSTVDGMEHIFTSSTQLRYGRDLRLNEVRRLLCSARPVAVQTSSTPTAVDQEFQQAQLWQLAQRTTALPVGRGAFTLATTCTLLTEALVIPKLVLAGRLPSQQNATVNLDPNFRNVQELKSWPEFHNAVAAGLKLAPLQGKMSRTWITYNKPEEPTVTHAGLLFALGLHGHLRVLTISDIYQYFLQEHESTTMAMMLGLATSYRGTMHPVISNVCPFSVAPLECQFMLQLVNLGIFYLADPSQATDTSCPSRSYYEIINSPPVFDPPPTCCDDCIFSKGKDPTIMESSIDDVVVVPIDKGSNVVNPMILETVIEKEIERIWASQRIDKESVVVGFPTKESCFKKESGLLRCLERKVVSTRKSLYFHLPSRHPSSFPEMEFPTVLQSAALMATGILYEGSAHPQTMQILLGEIGRRSGGDNALEREGYSVAAGYALGFVALGRGEDALGFVDTLVDRLCHYINGHMFLNTLLNCFLHQEIAPTVVHSIDDQNRNAGQMMDGTAVNVDVTAPGAIIALALMFLKSESEVLASRICIPQTHFNLQYVRPDFIMLRVIARNLILWNRVQPSRDWIDSQIPSIVKIGVKDLGDETDNTDEVDIEALVQAYVNILSGACISLGLRFAGTRNSDVQELLYHYAIYLLNEIKPVSVVSLKGLPKGLSRHVDRGTLEICLHLIVLSLSVVMAGSGHLQTFRLLRFLRNRNSCDGHASYGIQMAAFRHLYVMATEARWLQTVDVDTGLPVYAPIEVTTVETEHYSETTFCDVTPCILPERSVAAYSRMLYYTDEPWWFPGDKNDPFNGGIVFIKRKVGACSYVDDPIGCQSLLSRAMHKVCDGENLRACTRGSEGNGESGLFDVDQLVSTFSSDPSLIAFAKVFCDSAWNSRQVLKCLFFRSDIDFQEFCSQVLFDCVSKDRPALLQIALAYNEALNCGRLSISRGSIIQSYFLASLRKRVEDILDRTRAKNDLHNYMIEGKWPDEQKIVFLSWYLQWYGMPPSSVTNLVMEKIKGKVTMSSSVPLLRLLLPQTHINALVEIDKLRL
ncbi:hypothetical protein Sjap_014140 [Stephania japonica]|uniref:Anaphase-promoting complex subunit 1 n=1 Tax=Stephania japonica TaxID=461633 RepID=A0AAP0NZA5_9MAGN